MQTRKKAYLTPAARAYVLASKRRLTLILKERDITHTRLAAMTGIPASTISHWLNLSRPDFLGLGDAVMICDALEISIRDILPEATWRHQHPDRYAVLSFFLEIPLTHAKWLIVVYKGAQQIFRK